MQHKLKIEIAFVDKYTQQSYKIGEIITVDEARSKELLADSRGLVKKVERPKKTSKEKKSEE